MPSCRPSLLVLIIAHLSPRATGQDPPVLGDGPVQGPITTEGVIKSFIDFNFPNHPSRFYGMRLHVSLNPVPANAILPREPSIRPQAPVQPTWEISTSISQDDGTERRGNLTIPRTEEEGVYIAVRFRDNLIDNVALIFDEGWNVVPRGSLLVAKAKAPGFPAPFQFAFIGQGSFPVSMAVRLSGRNLSPSLARVRAEVVDARSLEEEQTAVPQPYLANMLGNPRFAGTVSDAGTTVGLIVGLSLSGAILLAGTMVGVWRRFGVNRTQNK